MSVFQPRRVRLGVTGHRLNQLPEAGHPAVMAAIEKSLAEVSAAAVAAGHGYSRLALVSALAEGADRIAAHAGLAKGWRLISPLPFKRRRYEQDFADAQSVAEFRTLYRRAEHRREIDGEALQAAEGAHQAAPYAAVGKAIVGESDILLAVWNGQPPKGPGGTAEVCARALDKGAPVLWIDADGQGPKLILPQGKPPAPRSFKARFWAGLVGRLERIERPANMRIAEG